MSSSKLSDDASIYRQKLLFDLSFKSQTNVEDEEIPTLLVLLPLNCRQARVKHIRSLLRRRRCAFTIAFRNRGMVKGFISTVLDEVRKKNERPVSQSRHTVTNISQSVALR